MTNVDKAIAGSFWSYQAAAPSATLAGQATLPDVLLRLVCTKQPANLARRDANVSSRYVRVSADVFAQLTHEGNAEFADLIVGFALGVEVGSTFASANVHWRRL